MTSRTRILLALLGCLVLGGNAVVADAAHCDPLCCETPCDGVPLAPDACPCCVVRSAGAGDPMVPVAPVAAPPAPAPVAALPDLPAVAPAAAAPSVTCPAAPCARPPAPSGPTNLRL